MFWRALSERGREDEMNLCILVDKRMDTGVGVQILDRETTSKVLEHHPPRHTFPTVVCRGNREGKT